MDRYIVLPGKTSFIFVCNLTVIGKDEHFKNILSVFYQKGINSFAPSLITEE